MAETWRIIHARGVMRAEVSLAMSTGHLAALSEWHGWRAVRIDAGELAIAAPEAMGDSAEEACARLAVGNGLAVREILAPGELTRAELRAQAFREGAEAMREALRAETCRVLENAGVAIVPHIIADLADAAIHTLPVPPRPEVSR